MDDWRGFTAGAKQSDVFAELTRAIEEFKVANESDPDPADALSEIVISEPANDWRAADK